MRTIDEKHCKRGDIMITAAGAVHRAVGDDDWGGERMRLAPRRNPRPIFLSAEQVAASQKAAAEEVSK